MELVLSNGKQSNLRSQSTSKIWIGFLFYSFYIDLVSKIQIFEKYSYTMLPFTFRALRFQTKFIHALQFDFETILGTQAKGH